MDNNTLNEKIVTAGSSRLSYGARLKKDMKKNRLLYLMVLPVLIWYALFTYLPMYGVTIAFQQFEPSLGYFKSPWVGLRNFKDFFSSIYFLRLLRNTLKISLTNILFGFPAPIILALLINELRNKYFVKTVQTVTYLPHFISLVVVCGMVKSFTGTGGIITEFVAGLTGNEKSLLMRPECFVPLYVITDIWQTVGWGSIIYISALSGIDTQLYEACEIDGGGKFIQMLNVTIPGILPTIIIMLILRMGQVLNVGYEKIILLYNSSIYETADVISSFTYRKGLQEFNWSYGSAVGVFNSAVNILFLILTNSISRRISETSLW